MKYLIILTAFIALAGCGLKGTDNTDRVVSTDSTYFFEAVGWEMKIPDGYEFLTKEDSEKLTEKGLEAVEESVDEEINVQPFEELISFRKDAQNMFIANTQLIDSVEYPSYEDLHFSVVDILVNTYKDQNIAVEHKSDTEVIGNREFYKEEFKLFTPDHKLVLTQVMYTRNFNGVELTTIINWTDEGFRDEVFGSWRNSTFGK